MEDKLAVVGAGTMGVGIAQVAASAGCPVVVIDPAPDALRRGEQNITQTVEKLVARGKMSADEAADILTKIQWSTKLDAAAACTVVIEAIVERMDIKRRLFANLSAIVGPDTVLASNTSSLSITQMAQDLSDPSRFLGVHFFNPVPSMKLVEIVAGHATAPEIVSRIQDMMRRWGKHPVSARDIPGFIVNRIARPFYAEAFLALEEGIDAYAIDTALRDSGGFRMGPLALADLIGHDINFAAAASVYEGLQPRTRFRPQPYQARLVEKGLLGRKSGQGVYDYATDPIAPPTSAALSDHVIGLGSDAGGLEWMRALAIRVEDRDLQPGLVVVDGVLFGMGDGRSLAKRSDVDALLDHAIDPAGARTLVVTARNDVAAQAAADLAGALGKQLILLADRPGQIVLRTLAQIANGAADAIHEDVASSQEINEAMIYGANYPVGPLEWTRLLGADRVIQTLRHIAVETGDTLYTPSKGFDEGSA